MKTMLAAMLLAASAMGDVQPAMEIVLPGKPSPVEAFAAKELAEHWRMATGKDAATVADASGGAAWVFRLGRAAKIDVSGLAKNSAMVRIGKGVVDIAGPDSMEGQPLRRSTVAGTLFGVYDFLEREMGVRWLWPGELGTICPARRNPVFAPKEWTIHPMAFAEWRTSSKGVKSAAWSDRAAAERFYANESLWLRRHRFSTTDRLAKGHAFTKWFPRHGKSHPEWFNELPDGSRRPDPLYMYGRPHIVSLCASNPDVARQVVREWADENADDIVNGNENDTPGKCCCPACLKADATGDDAGRRERAAARFAAKDPQWFREIGSTSTRYAMFWKALLDESAKVRPDSRVIGCVYANYSSPPKDGTWLGERMILRFCPPVMYPWTDEKVKFFKDTWTGWSRTGAKMMMRPNFTLDGHGFPLAYYRRFADCYDFVRVRGLAAVDMDSLTGMYGANGLTTYVIAAKNSTPDATVADMENDYFSAFGSSAGTMRQCCAEFVKATESGYAMKGDEDTVEGGKYTDFILRAYRVFPQEMMERACGRIEAAAASEADALAARRLRFVLTGLKDALLALKAQSAFVKYTTSGDRTDFSRAYADLLAFRRANEALGYANLATLNSYESRHWPRHFALLRPESRELEGWELALSPEPEERMWKGVKLAKPWKPGYNGIGWYRCRFELEDPSKFRRLVVGAVDGEPTIIINGKTVQSGHPVKDSNVAWLMPFAVDVAGALKTGGNEIKVKIEKKLPGRRGITSSVYLD